MLTVEERGRGGERESVDGGRERERGERESADGGREREGGGRKGEC